MCCERSSEGKTTRIFGDEETIIERQWNCGCAESTIVRTVPPFIDDRLGFFQTCDDYYAQSN